MAARTSKNNQFLREVGIITLQLIKLTQNDNAKPEANRDTNHTFLSKLKDDILTLQHQMNLSVSDRYFNRLAQNEMQHPEYKPEREWDESDYFDRECSDDFGKTYACYLTKTYGGPNGFADKPSYGECTQCSTPLPVWRRCVPCAYLYFDRLGKEIYTSCMECTNKDHQRDLETIDLCEFCWGPPSLRIEFRNNKTNPQSHSPSFTITEQ